MSRSSFTAPPNTELVESESDIEEDIDVIDEVEKPPSPDQNASHLRRSIPLPPIPRKVSIKHIHEIKH